MFNDDDPYRLKYYNRCNVDVDDDAGVKLRLGSRAGCAGLLELRLAVWDTERVPPQRNAPPRVVERYSGQCSIHLRLDRYSRFSAISHQRKETADSLDGAVYDIRDQERSQPNYSEPPLAR